MSILTMLKEGRALDIDAKGSTAIQESYPVTEALPILEIRSSNFGMALFGQSYFGKSIKGEDKPA
tara:strand:- start:323 stop:517 length:195 start_codon:yes stop_codon:yes gene_type:complete